MLGKSVVKLTLYILMISSTTLCAEQSGSTIFLYLFILL